MTLSLSVLAWAAYVCDLHKRCAGHILQGRCFFGAHPSLNFDSGRHYNLPTLQAPVLQSGISF